jgi:AcrR family transcriptional regulator
VSTIVALDFGDDHRSRLLAGLAASIREKGLTGTQISDIVRHARTSRRTFYECFADKDACFLELAERMREGSLAIVNGAVDREAAWDKQVDQAIEAYLGLLAADPRMTIAFSSELPTLGGAWMEIRTIGIEQYAQLVVELSRLPTMAAAGLAPLSLEKAVMIVAGIDGMAVRAARAGASILDLAAPAREVAKAALLGAPPRLGQA